MGKLVHQVEARAKIERHRRNDLPFVLQVIAVEPSGLAARIEDRERLIAGLHAHLVDRQDARIGVECRALSLDVKAAAEGVIRGRSPAPVALHPGSDAAPIGGLADAGVEDRRDRVSGGEVDAAVAVEARDLKIDRARALLQCDDRVIVDLPLVLVEGGRGDIADAVDGEPEARRQAGNVRDLELAARCAEDRGQPGVRIDDA